MFREALNYPTDGDHGSAALLLGGFLTLVLAAGEAVAVFAAGERSLALGAGALLVVLAVRVLLRGQYVAVLNAVAGKRAPVAPRFRGWSRVTTGLASGLLLVVYLLPAGLLLGGGLYTGRLELTGPTGTAVGTAGGFALLAGIFALLAAAYTLPAAATLYATESRLRSGLALRRVGATVLTEDYAVGWMIAALTVLVLWPVAYLLQFLLVGVFFRFYLNTAVRYMHGRAVGDALGLDRGPPEPRSVDGRLLQPAVRPVDGTSWDAGDTAADGDPSARRESTGEPGVGARDESPDDEGIEPSPGDPMGEEFQ